mmetsp:Transcript_8054/g.12029  ORF Transcript_8054/g.12029 Transcript_8054/m.12029 type:complete len:582 (-) Transcript_8054:175-1920(-)|eukprot:CAMPEP_0185039540 /NCGR_PEP_ID=MMETSP1103-20130426/36473_1 /TAXON_ID=36769 /ORGANISM="Paraphysomonas bandaiensis, Strain Caron Lab Isolate" /LENGTH=581 /DNA_ID=CAMNT_0027578467 /DNA_START=128 /DNA_END=1873 /DNA_ORIENTATION=-
MTRSSKCKKSEKKSLCFPVMMGGAGASSFCLETASQENDGIDSNQSLDWEEVIGMHQKQLLSPDSTDKSLGSLSKLLSTPTNHHPQTHAPDSPRPSQPGSANNSTRRKNLVDRLVNIMDDCEDITPGVSDPVSPLSSVSSPLPSRERRLTVGKYQSNGRRIKSKRQLAKKDPPSVNLRRGGMQFTGSLGANSSMLTECSDITDVECARYMHPPRVSLSCDADWMHSSAMQLALNGENDDFTADLKSLVTKVCEYKAGSSSRHLLDNYTDALKLLLQLHRELKCPPAIHRAFWEAHSTPTNANLVTVLSRVISLADSRFLLFDLLRACSGNPSPKLLTRMLEESKEKQKARECDTDMFARLNFFGQSSAQIRARAHATAISVPRPPGIQRTPASSQTNAPDEIPQALRKKSKRRTSSIVATLDSIRRTMSVGSDDSDRESEPKTGHSPPRMGTIPFEFNRLKQNTENTTTLGAIVENNEGESSTGDDTDDDDMSTSVPEAQKAKTNPKPIVSNQLRDIDAPNRNPPPVRVARKRITLRCSVQEVHLSLLKTICYEWMDSVPWKVEEFVCGGRVIARASDRIS